MRLKTLTLINNQGDTLELPLEDPPGGFLVQNVEGLGPVKATLVSSSYASIDGEQYHTSHRGARNIVITLGLTPDYAFMSPNELRNQLYNYVMPKSNVTLRAGMFNHHDPNTITQNFDVEIEGRVESLEANMFTNTPSVDLSIICYDSDFCALTTKQFSGVTVDDLTEVTLDYDGTVETGAIFTLNVDRPMTDFAIYHITPQDELRAFNFVLALQAADEVVFNSTVGEKSARLTRSGVVSSVLYAVTPQSAWLRLSPGANRLRIYSADDPDVPWTIDYVTKYGGL